MGITWSEERKELLKKLWAQGLEKEEIAPLIGSGCTANAVGGKAHHMGLPRRSPAKRQKNAVGSPVDIVTASVPAVSKPNGISVCAYRPSSQEHDCDEDPLYREEESSRSKCSAVRTIAEGCRWPIGDPLSAKFKYCGKERRTGKPYCDVHESKAHPQESQPPRKRQRVDA